MPLLVRKDFYVMRHAETADNVQDLASGDRPGVLLTSLGETQARYAANLFDRIFPRPVYIVASALERTAQTAGHTCASVLGGKLPEHCDPRLNELSLGHKLNGVAKASHMGKILRE